jgi:hypothetical protein
MSDSPLMPAAPTPTAIEHRTPQMASGSSTQMSSEYVLITEQ